MSILGELEARSHGVKHVRGIYGSEDRPLFNCTIELAGATVDAVIVGMADLGFPVIGRDLLKDFKIAVDWKKKTINLEDP
jgi:hypothetical protein